MKKYSLILALVIAAGLKASTADAIKEYVAMFADRSDIPAPVHVVAPKVSPSEQGRVTLDFKVTPQGEVRDVAVVKHTGSVTPEVIAQAVNAWKFRPSKGQTADTPVVLTVAVNVD